MKILGIDYGKKKVGIAIGDSDSRLAEPLKVINYIKEVDLINKVQQVLQVLQVQQVVLGMSEGRMGEATRSFGKKLEDKFNIEVVFQDEILTTQDAQRLSQEAGMKKVKRKKMEDAFAATLILQSYLDSVI